MSKYKEIKDRQGGTIHAGVPPGSKTAWIEIKGAGLATSGICLTEVQISMLIRKLEGAFMELNKARKTPNGFDQYQAIMDEVQTEINEGNE